jgi:hypothetical protein
MVRARLCHLLRLGPEVVFGLIRLFLQNLRKRNWSHIRIAIRWSRDELRIVRERVSTYDLLVQHVLLVSVLHVLQLLFLLLLPRSCERVSRQEPIHQVHEALRY